MEVKSLEAGPGVTKHVYVMEPDVPGGSSVHPSLLGLAHVRGDKEVASRSSALQLYPSFPRLERP